MTHVWHLWLQESELSVDGSKHVGFKNDELLGTYPTKEDGKHALKKYVKEWRAWTHEVGEVNEWEPTREFDGDPFVSQSLTVSTLKSGRVILARVTVGLATEKELGFTEYCAP